MDVRAVPRLISSMVHSCIVPAPAPVWTPSHLVATSLTMWPSLLLSSTPMCLVITSPVVTAVWCLCRVIMITNHQSNITTWWDILEMCDIDMIHFRTLPFCKEIFQCSRLKIQFFKYFPLSGIWSSDQQHNVSSWAHHWHGGSWSSSWSTCDGHRQAGHWDWPDLWCQTGQGWIHQEWCQPC